MATLTPKNFSNLKHIQTVDKKYFRELLSRFPDDCNRHGLDLDHLTDDSLFGFFTSFDTTTSGDLVEVMHLLSELSMEDGADRLCSQARKRGHDLAGGKDLDPREIAIRAYLWSKDTVVGVHDRIGYEKVTSFHEYIGARAATIATPSDAVLRRMEERLAAYFDKEDRGRFCEMRAWAEGSEIDFIVIHGKRYARERVRDERNRPKTLPFRPEKHDAVIYDNRTGRLKINAQRPQEKDEYRRVFGELLFGDAAHFVRTDVFDLGPIQRRGAAALDAAGIAGIQWVRLHEFKLLVGIDGGKSFEHHLRARDRAGNVFDYLATYPGVDIRQGQITYAKFLVKLDGVRGGPRTLEVFWENRAKYHRWTHGEAVALWLERNGFVALPLALASPPARPPARRTAAAS